MRPFLIDGGARNALNAEHELNEDRQIHHRFPKYLKPQQPVFVGVHSDIYTC